MSIINGHTTRAIGTVLTAAIYNADHSNHVVNAQTLNADKMEGTPPPVVDGHVVVWNGVAGNALRTGGYFAANDAGQVFTGEVQVSNSGPFFALNETDAAANNRLWYNYASATVLKFAASNDARTVEDAWLSVARSGSTVGVIDFLSADATELKRGGFNIWDQNNVAARIAAMTEDTTPDVNADFVIIRDATDGSIKKTLPNKFGVAATQAEMEAATITTAFSTPLRQQFHPGHPKAWVRFNNAATIAASFNVASITDVAIGRWTVNIATDFSSANYCGIGFGGRGTWNDDPLTDGTIMVYNVYAASAAGTFDIVGIALSFSSASGFLGIPDFADPTINEINVAFFGDQA